MGIRTLLTRLMFPTVISLALLAGAAVFLAGPAAASVIKDPEPCDVRASNNELFTDSRPCQDVQVKAE